jgi:SAM-dependent methyltransferase
MSTQEVPDWFAGAGVGEIRVGADWLALREPADAAAHAADLAEEVRRMLPPGPVVVHDLGCGTGSMARWLAPRLGRPQHWVLYDRDPDLLVLAAVALAPAPRPARAAGGAPRPRRSGEAGASATVETRQRDITRLRPDDLDGAHLVTASAVLDMFTADELGDFVRACAGVGCPVLLTISVTGHVELDPAHPLDAAVAAAFNDHERRDLDGRRLLGPDAVGAAAQAFAHLGREVLVRPSPWRLGPPQAGLAAEWFVGWLGAAVDQRPDLAAATVEYARWRLSQAATGRLGVTVHHSDLLIRPR